MKSANKSRFPAFHTIAVFSSLVVSVLVLGPVNGPEIDAALSQPADADNDILPDVLELLLGTKPYDMDTDGDTVPDGVEYVLHSDPNDGLSYPTLEPAMRVAAYLEDGYLKLCILFFPGNVEFLQDFCFNVAYGEYFPDRDLVVNQFNLTNLIPMMVMENEVITYKNIQLTSYVLAIPATVVNAYAPMSFGFAAKLLHVSPLYDVADIDIIDGVPVRLFTGNEFGLENTEGFFSALNHDPPENWDDNEVCVTTLQNVGSTDGVTTYEITDAQCNTMLKQICSAGKCADKVGDQVVTIDPGFLISNLEE
jgi:hypothetical protein